ncbi:MAG: phosphodiester glycosidase family protein [Burkholderiaceae bacterium]
MTTTLLIGGCGGGDSQIIHPVAAWAFASTTPPLGAGKLGDTRGQVEIAPGATLYSLVVGRAAADDGYEVNLGFVRNMADAKPLIDVLAAAGYKTKFVASADNALTGYSLRLDQHFLIQTDADNAVTKIKALTTLPASTPTLAVGAGRVYTAEDGTATAGPYHINLIAIRPTFSGLLKSALGTDIVPGRETTTSLSQRNGALAAINGGFFVTGRPNGTEGALAGLSIIDGRLINEGIDGRPALFLEKRAGGKVKAHIERRLVTTITVSINGSPPKRIDGTNRRPGVTTNCGHAPSVETSVPVHDAVCTNPDDIVVYTKDFGGSTSVETTANTAEVVIDGSGTVTAVSNVAGSAIPASGQVLQGIGKGAQWLLANIVVGAKVGIDRKLTNGNNQPLPLTSGMWAVNGGPTLLVDGAEVPTDHAAEGWGNSNIPGYGFDLPNGNRANFYNGFYLRRNPRTAVGVAADGTILLMVADGRAPTYSAGLSIPETALVMKHFGAVNAINLDGGGSSMMVVNQHPLTLPSDNGRVERPDGDGILIFNQ